MPTTYAQKQTTAQKKDASSASSVLDASSQSESLQRKADMANGAMQRAEAPRPNNTGMPDNLKAGIESLSGFSMDDVRVHYNSSKPATVQALAYTQGTDIHVAPGQEKHLPHEAWHVAQQMAGRVSPTTNINGMPVNDNAALEHEADVMGEKAVQCKSKNAIQLKGINQSVVQRHQWTCYYSNEKVKSLTYLGPDSGDKEVSSPTDTTKVQMYLEKYIKSKWGNISGSFVMQWSVGQHSVVRQEYNIREYLNKSVNIGTEFTFRKTSGWKSLSLTEEKDQTGVAKEYGDSIKAFADQMKAFCGTEPVKFQDDKCKLVGVEGRQLTVQLPNSRRKFTVTISIDDNCIELQTTPISYDIYRLNAFFINKLIFESAKNAGLEAATDKKDGSGTVVEYGGGGHISLDSQSAFAGDVNILHEFIKRYTTTAKEEVDGGRGSFSYNDKRNSPLIENVPYLDELLEQSKGDVITYVNKLKEAYTTGRTIKQHELEGSKGVEVSDLSHYQAVNVDNFLGKGGRIEMRNFDAQKDIGDLFNQVDALYEILAQVYYEVQH